MSIFKIGNVILENTLVLAPMAGVTGQAFRRLCKEQGAGLVVTEMVSAKAITYNNKNTKKLLKIGPEERPIGVQLFGSDPSAMVEAARICEGEVDPDFIDINMGCPAPKIVKNGDGSALLKDPTKAISLAEKVVGAVNVPVTCKIRLGWDKKTLVHKIVAEGLYRAGVSAITVHGRVRDQYYSGIANWDAISEVAEAVPIPVIGNGDIWKPEDALEMQKQTGCKAVAVGRGALGNPWIFRDILALKNHIKPNPVTLWEKATMAKRHASLLLEYINEEIAILEMRKHLAWYLKGEKFARLKRKQINSIKTFQDLESLIENILSISPR